MLEEVSKRSYILLQKPQQVSYSFYEIVCVITNRLHKFNFHERCVKRKPLLSEDMKTRLKFARKIIDKYHFWNKVPCSSFGHLHHATPLYHVALKENVRKSVKNYIAKKSKAELNPASQ